MEDMDLVAATNNPDLDHSGLCRGRLCSLTQDAQAESALTDRIDVTIICPVECEVEPQLLTWVLEVKPSATQIAGRCVYQNSGKPWTVID